MKFLIDECLSAELVALAVERGHVESSHVRWIGKAGLKDWSLLPVILDGDWTFVTRNAYDFRGPPDSPGSKDEYAKTTLHAALDPPPAKRGRGTTKWWRGRRRPGCRVA